MLEKGESTYVDRWATETRFHGRSSSLYKSAERCKAESWKRYIETFKAQCSKVQFINCARDALSVGHLSWVSLTTRLLQAPRHQTRKPNHAIPTLSNTFTSASWCRIDRGSLVMEFCGGIHFCQFKNWGYIQGQVRGLNMLKSCQSFGDMWLTPVGRLSHKSALKAPVPLGATDGLKIILTATEDGKGKQPHQAFLLLRDPKSGLEATFPFSVKDTGKAKVDVVCIASQFSSANVPDNLL